MTADEDLEAELRALFAKLDPVPLVSMTPCLFTMPLDEGRAEWCRIDGGRPHRIHVSNHGVYRWNDRGELIPTPRHGTPAFEIFYRAHPDGQGDYRQESPPQAPHKPHSAETGPQAVQDRPGLFDRFWARWRSYDDLPALRRQTARVGYATGFALAFVGAFFALAAGITVISIAVAWALSGLAP